MTEFYNSLFILLGRIPSRGNCMGKGSEMGRKYEAGVGMLAISATIRGLDRRALCRVVYLKCHLGSRSKE